MRRIVLAGAVVATLLSACSDEAPTGIQPSSDQPVSSQSTAPAEDDPAPVEAEPDTIDVTTTPDEVTIEWVEAVVNTILAEYSGMVREVLRTPVAGEPSAIAGYAGPLSELFGGQYEDDSQQELARLMVDQDGARAEYLPPDEMGALAWAGITVLAAEPGCIVAVGRVDRSATVPQGGPAEVLSAVSLARRDGASPSNPTQWSMLDLLPNNDADGEPNADSVMLEATLATFGAALDHDCDGGG